MQKVKKYANSRILSEVANHLRDNASEIAMFETWLSVSGIISLANDIEAYCLGFTKSELIEFAFDFGLSGNESNILGQSGFWID